MTLWRTLPLVVVAAGCAQPNPDVVTYNNVVDTINECLNEAGWETELEHDRDAGVKQIWIVVDEDEPGERSGEVTEAWDTCSSQHETLMSELMDRLTR